MTLFSIFDWFIQKIKSVIWNVLNVFIGNNPRRSSRKSKKDSTRFPNKSESPLNSDDGGNSLFSRSRRMFEVESDTDLLTRTSETLRIEVTASTEWAFFCCFVYIFNFEYFLLKSYNICQDWANSRRKPYESFERLSTL